MPKQTIEFIKNMTVFGLTHGCVHNIIGSEKSALYNDKAYVEALIKSAHKIRADLNKKSALFKRLTKAKTAEDKVKYSNEIANIKTVCDSSYIFGCNIAAVDFVREATHRAMYLASFTHCTAVKQEQSLEFDLNFINCFLQKCTTKVNSLRGSIEASNCKIPELSFDKLRNLLKEIQNQIIVTGYSSCFYCELSTVASSDDIELKNDLDFFKYSATHLSELKYVLNSDKTALIESLKLDQKLKLDSSTRDGFKGFRMKLSTFKPTSDKNDKKLQFCHYYVIHGLFYISSAHLINQFNPVAQMKLIDSSFEFFKTFSEKCISSFERLNIKHGELVRQEDAAIVSAAKVKDDERPDYRNEPITPLERGVCKYYGVCDTLKDFKLKRKETTSMYDLAEILRPAQYHCGRPSYLAAQELNNLGKISTAIPEEVEADHITEEVEADHITKVAEPVIENVAVPVVEEDGSPAVTPKPKGRSNKKAPIVQAEDIDDEPCVTPKDKPRTRKPKKVD